MSVAIDEDLQSACTALVKLLAELDRYRGPTAEQIRFAIQHVDRCVKRINMASGDFCVYANSLRLPLHVFRISAQCPEIRFFTSDKLGGLYCNLGHDWPLVMSQSNIEALILSREDAPKDLRERALKFHEVGSTRSRSALQTLRFAASVSDWCFEAIMAWPSPTGSHLEHNIELLKYLVGSNEARRQRVVDEYFTDDWENDKFFWNHAVKYFVYLQELTEAELRLLLSLGKTQLGRKFVWDVLKAGGGRNCYDALFPAVISEVGVSDFPFIANSGASQGAGLVFAQIEKKLNASSICSRHDSNSIADSLVALRDAKHITEAVYQANFGKLVTKLDRVDFELYFKAGRLDMATKDFIVAEYYSYVEDQVGENSYDPIRRWLNSFSSNVRRFGRVEGPAIDKVFSRLSNKTRLAENDVLFLAALLGTVDIPSAVADAVCDFVLNGKAQGLQSRFAAFNVLHACGVRTGNSLGCLPELFHHYANQPLNPIWRSLLRLLMDLFKENREFPFFLIRPLIDSMFCTFEKTAKFVHERVDWLIVKLERSDPDAFDKRLMVALAKLSLFRSRSRQTR